MKKVLVIVYYWPPSGGAGVQRWLKFVKYLPQFGWQPTVVTTKNGDYPAIDHSLENDVPENVKVIRTKTTKFGNLFHKSKIPYGSLETTKEDPFFKKVSIWIRLNLIIPDARKVWNKFALEAAFKEMRTTKYDAVITSGPPHSTHLVGYKLKKIFGIKWLADFRDPWTKIDYLKKVKRNKIAESLDKKLERQVTSSCDLVLGINQKILEDLHSKNHEKIIPNGFDPADFENISKTRSSCFRLNYFGSISKERNPRMILEAVNSIHSEVPQIDINIWGNVSEEVKTELLGLDEYQILSCQAYIPHVEMLQKMINSNLLLLLINDVPDNKGIITGKIFEYLGAEVPILGFGPVDGEAAAILRETGSGKMFDYKDSEGIAAFIKRKYDQWRKKEYFQSSKKLSRFSRKEQTRELSGILNQL